MVTGDNIITKKEKGMAESRIMMEVTAGEVMKLRHKKTNPAPITGISGWRDATS